MEKLDYFNQSQGWKYQAISTNHSAENIKLLAKLDLELGSKDS